ncbi:MAG: Lpg1974 family pore-forming outer membrane protein [Gemmataceae bacterium]|nr:Lpg1974 family pore-forming outer membrane protein [Gemmata sp.]MDW8197488.1 Lpg1974 family pore-forming outer membrane protein [Gemmataceae bacterium]
MAQKRWEFDLLGVVIVVVAGATAACAQPPAYPAGGGMSNDHPPLRELPGLDDLIPINGPGKHGFARHSGHDSPTGPDGIPPYLTPFLPHHTGWYVQGEFLLMRPRNSDFDYVVRNLDTGLAIRGPIESLKYGVGTGFRIETGYHFGDGNWDAAFAYTYFTSGDNSTVLAGGGILYPTLTRPGLIDRALSATADADLDYNNFDMLAARRVQFDDHFGLRFLGGFRFNDTKQILNAFYDGADARLARVNTRSRFQGFGPLIGVEGVMVAWHGFHLYSRAIAGLISGRNSNAVIETNDNGATTYVNTRYDVQKVVPMGSLAIGGGWQYRTLSLRAGFEVTHWQGMFERPRVVDDVAPGKVQTRPSNLTLEGLFIQAGLNF